MTPPRRRSGLPQRGPTRTCRPIAHPDYAIVTVSLKAHGPTPGDASSEQMRLIWPIWPSVSAISDLRISHEQNVVLPHVHKADLPALHAALREAGLATANAGLISDIIACPGMDYCALATARSIPIAAGDRHPLSDAR
jgi:sulfite reductase (NADPH) hemoprotein beta-component